MPVIAVNISAAVFEEIKEYVRKGLYESPEQLLEIAAFNQVALERGVNPEDVIARGHRVVPESGIKQDLNQSSARKGKQNPIGSRRSAPVPASKNRIRNLSELDITDVFKRINIKTDIEAGPPAIPAMVRPADERLWGQVNRVFPLKLACRWLLVNNSGKQSWDRFEKISDQLADDAAMIGSVMEQFDMGAGRKRDDLLSTGLPRAGNIASRDRYLSQFVARITRAAEIYPGAICQYALAVFDGDRLVLTDRGSQLGQFHNPILDSDMSKASVALSDVERSFFIDQVIKYVPGELRDFTVVLRALLSGHITPEDLFQKVRASFPADWSGGIAHTHVSGIISRLADIALLKRRWAGRYVKYEASTEVSDIIARLEGSQID